MNQLFSNGYKLPISILILSLTFVFSSANGQMSKRELEKYLFNEAPYIFEGHIQSRTTFPTTYPNKRWYTSNIVEITKVFRGDLELGTVEIITPGGGGTMKEGFENSVVMYPDHQPQFGNGIMFCSLSDFPSNNPNASNPEKLYIWHTISFLDGLTPPAGGFGRRFENWSELKAYLLGYENITIPNAEYREYSPKEKKKQHLGVKESQQRTYLTPPDKKT